MLEADDTEAHGAGAGEVPPGAAGGGTGLTLFGDRQVNVLVALVLVGLRGGDGKTDAAVQLRWWKFCGLSHPCVRRFHPDDKIDVRSIHKVCDDVAALISAVKNHNRLAVKDVALEHLGPCPGLSFWGRAGSQRQRRRARTGQSAGLSGVGCSHLGRCCCRRSWARWGCGPC